MQTVNDDLDTEEVAKRLRERLGDLSEAKDVRFDYTIRPGKPITLQFASDSIADLELLADDVRASLERYPGVFDISDSFDAPLEELVLSLKPAAENLGITLADVARQIRQAFYGEEVQRIPRDGEDIRVMVRYPESERRAIANINSMYIRTSDGREVPFSTVAAYRVETGYQSIERLIACGPSRWLQMSPTMAHRHALLLSLFYRTTHRPGFKCTLACRSIWMASCRKKSSSSRPWSISECFQCS